MSDISERLVVHCPVTEAGRHLAAFIRAHGNTDGDVVCIPLRLPVELFGSRYTAVERTVVATLHPLRSHTDPLPTYSVVWAARNGGPFPTFAGALAVEDAGERETFRLLVTGHYDPPLSVAGAAFDATFGRRIAHASARDLLRTIANFVEYAHARAEASKAGRRV